MFTRKEWSLVKNDPWPSLFLATFPLSCIIWTPFCFSHATCPPWPAEDTWNCVSYTNCVCYTNLSMWSSAFPCCTNWNMKPVSRSYRNISIHAPERPIAHTNFYQFSLFQHTPLLCGRSCLHLHVTVLNTRLRSNFYISQYCIIYKNVRTEEWKRGS